MVAVVVAVAVAVVVAVAVGVAVVVGVVVGVAVVVVVAVAVGVGVTLPRLLLGWGGVLTLTLLLALLPASAVANCRFACVAHKVTDLKRLTHGLQGQLEEDEERIDRQSASISALRERNVALEATGASLTAAYGFLAQRFTSLTDCLGEIPLTRYGQPEGPSGYLFRLDEADTLVFPTTALDVSYDNSPVGAWTFVDTCNHSRVQTVPTQLSGLVRQSQGPRGRFDESQIPDPRFRWRTER